MSTPNNSVEATIGHFCPPNPPVFEKVAFPVDDLNAGYAVPDRCQFCEKESTHGHHGVVNGNVVSVHTCEEHHHRLIFPDKLMEEKS